MNNTVLKLLANPVVTQIILCFNSKSKFSAKDLHKQLPDIPPATLYRYINKLYENNLLCLVETKNNRGAVEKIYSLNLSSKELGKKNPQSISPKLYFDMFLEFSLGLVSEFNEYSKSKDANVKEDGTGFSTAPIFATKEELEFYSKKITEILKPAMTRKNKSQNLYSFVSIITPPKKCEGEK